jgi:hypothetical protein
VFSSKVNQFGAHFALERNDPAFHFVSTNFSKISSSHFLPAIQQVRAIFETKRNGVFQDVTGKLSD